MTARARLAIVLLALALCAIGGARHATASNSSAHIDSAARLDVAQAPCIGASSVEGASVQQQTVHHAGLVVVFPDGAQSWCIEFTGDDISGTDLLRQSGLSVVFAGFGGLGSGVCRIEEVGCSDPGDCFCQCRGADCHYWNYFALRDGNWSYLALGPSQHHLHDGDTDAWVWGAGPISPGDARAPCPLTQPTPVPTPTPKPAVAPPPPSSDGSTGDSGEVANAPPRVAAGATIIVTTRPSATSAVATRTPPPQVAAREQSGDVNSTAASKKNSGGGPPAGLIAFGAMAAVLVLGIGGVALRRRLGG